MTIQVGDKLEFIADYDGVGILITEGSRAKVVSINGDAITLDVLGLVFVDEYGYCESYSEMDVTISPIYVLMSAIEVIYVD